MFFNDIQMDKGSVFAGEKIGELTKFIINKFSEEKLSHDEAIEVLEATKRVLGEFSFVNSIN